MASCKATPPPTESELLYAVDAYPDITNPWEARVLIVMEHSTALAHDIGRCNLQLKKLKEWVSEQQEIEVRDASRRNLN